MSCRFWANWPRSRKRRVTGLTVLVIWLAVLAGCATDGRVQPHAPARKTAEKNAVAVTQLADGREGFVIREEPQMDERSRRDFERAVALMKEQNHAQAIELLSKIIEQSPGVTAPYINIAIAYRKIGEPDQAEKHLKSALELVPGHPAACNEYGLLCRASGRFDEARALYEQALARFPDYYPVHRNLGILCDLYLGDLACALEHYEVYSRFVPDDRQVTIWIADLRARLGRDSNGGQ